MIDLTPKGHPVLAYLMILAGFSQAAVDSPKTPETSGRVSVTAAKASARSKPGDPVTIEAKVVFTPVAGGTIHRYQVTGEILGRDGKVEKEVAVSYSDSPAATGASGCRVEFAAPPGKFYRVSAWFEVKAGGVVLPKTEASSETLTP